MKTKHHDLIEEIQKRSFKLLMDLTNFNENEKGYGLTLDHNLKLNVASIATTGFVLSGYIIALNMVI